MREEIERIYFRGRSGVEGKGVHTFPALEEGAYLPNFAKEIRAFSALARGAHLS